jgi:hypothetical protein
VRPRRRGQYYPAQAAKSLPRDASATPRRERFAWPWQFETAALDGCEAPAHTLVAVESRSSYRGGHGFGGTSWNSMELSAIVGVRGVGTPWEARPMSSGSAAKEFEAFARDCVQLAAQADTPELRERLLSMARDWMRAAMEEDDAAPSTGHALRRRRFQPSRGAA